uniref:NADH-ubiquinone oxidoreductase chain 2 n=1 Tax=Teredorus bashanensis TaxID=2936563 RepID=A0A8T9VVR6_9ORTH|nr:NADH dehydrogenase subunit 2 [Teredorus bashanensis]UPH84304.1 NADH dehydrogenase subunit 2 [Teredorus bashanensis]
MLFMTTLVLSTIITMTANSWLGIWMGLEINLMSFIPMISKQKNNLSSIKYFIVQAIASITLLTSFIIMMMKISNQEMIIIMTMTLSIMLKIGAAPLHFWFPEVMENLSWENCILLMTWQKIAPMSVLSYLQPTQTYMTVFIITSAIIGAMMGLNQISLRLVMTYSSINHISWMLASIQSNMMVWTYYFMIYSLLTTIISMMFKADNINSINELFMNKNENKINKLNMMMSLMSLAGMPPLLGFLPKWILIQEMMQKSMYLSMMILIMSSTVTLYFYMKLFLSGSMMMFKQNKWVKNFSLSTSDKTALYLNTLSTTGIILSTLLIM